MLKDAIDLGQVRRALVVRLMFHGDVLLSTPVISTLKRMAPHVKVDALVYHETRDMLTLHPDLDQLFTIDRTWKKRGVLFQLQQELRLLSALKARRYDLIIILNDSHRATWLVKLLSPRWAVGPDNPARGRLYRKTVKRRFKTARHRHMVELHLDALRCLGLPVDSSAREARLSIVPGGDADASVVQRLSEFGLRGGDFVLVHPGSRGLYKCWPEHKMAQLIDLLQQEGMTVVLSGSPAVDEMAMLARIKARLGRSVIDLSGQLSLKELAALVARAAMLVGVDSLPVHLASAFQVPVVALFGPSLDLVWGPWQTPHRVVGATLACRPCGFAGCGESGQSDCMSALGVQEVFDAVHSLRSETENYDPNSRRHRFENAGA